MFSSSRKNNLPKVSHYSTVYFLRYSHPKYIKFLIKSKVSNRNCRETRVASAQHPETIRAMPFPLLSYLGKKNQTTVVKTEAVAQRCSVKKVFLEISQNSQENTRVRVSLLIKL